MRSYKTCKEESLVMFPSGSNFNFVSAIVSLIFVEYVCVLLPSGNKVKCSGPNVNDSSLYMDFCPLVVYDKYCMHMMISLNTAIADNKPTKTSTYGQTQELLPVDLSFNESQSDNEASSSQNQKVDKLPGRKGIDKNDTRRKKPNNGNPRRYSTLGVSTKDGNLGIKLEMPMGQYKGKILHFKNIKMLEDFISNF